jgi:hypothetical protein
LRGTASRRLRDAATGTCAILRLGRVVNYAPVLANARAKFWNPRTISIGRQLILEAVRRIANTSAREQVIRKQLLSRAATIERKQNFSSEK